MHSNVIGGFIRNSRKVAGFTQEEFALRSGFGLRFVHDPESGKPTVRLDKVNQTLAMFGIRAVPGRQAKREDEASEFPCFCRLCRNQSVFCRSYDSRNAKPHSDVAKALQRIAFLLRSEETSYFHDLRSFLQTVVILSAVIDLSAWNNSDHQGHD